MHIRIFNHYVQSPYVLLSIVEFIVLVVCGYVSVMPGVLTSGVESFGVDRLSLQYALIYAAVMLLSTFAMGVYSSGAVEGFGNMLIRSVVSYCLLGAAAMVVLYYAVPELYIGRDALFGAVTLSLVAILALRWVFYSLVDVAQLKRRILVLGVGERARGILNKFNDGQIMGSEIVGFISTSPGTAGAVAERVLDASGGVKALVDQHKINEIVVAVDERRKDKGSLFPLDELLNCKLSGTRITEVVEFYERELACIDLKEINTSWMVFGGQFRYRQLRDVSKRLLDVFLSLLLLTIAWPLMLLTMIAVYLETGGPVIYKQQRVGYNGQLFGIFKFRSMYQDAEKDGKAVWAQRNDRRITRVGAFIRNTRLDELPQVFNVLMGHMSFVGPRPERPEFVESLSADLPYYNVRHRVRPGLMGWAQLKYAYGASVEDAANKLMYDLYYVKNHSFLLDILIIVQSVEVILLGKGVR